MGATVRWFRNAGVYLLFVIVYELVSILAYLAVFVRDQFFDHAKLEFATPVATMVAGFIAMHAAVAFLNRFFRPYPARAFAGTFIGTSVFLVAWNLVYHWHWRLELDLVSWSNQLGLAVGCITGWYLLWIQRGDV